MLDVFSSVGPASTGAGGFSSWRWSVSSVIALMERGEVRAREVLGGAEARLREAEE
ncbi:hypothetical protein ACIQPR_05910 [Streptomyces sp. NPDC091280]|uniref:hypothetical protein n=1 Tax=Streptomyces sp. NPDC091280 TaxID=3365984 RepID=UPI003800EB07